jgi:hypothetical protein
LLSVRGSEQRGIVPGHSGRRAIDWQAGRTPRLESADDVGGVPETELLQRGSGEAGLEALVAEKDDPLVRPRERVVSVRARRIEAPLEYVARDEVGAGHGAVSFVLSVGADVDQQRTLPHGGERLIRREPAQPPASVVEELLDGDRRVLRRGRRRGHVRSFRGRPYADSGARFNGRSVSIPNVRVNSLVRRSSPFEDALA